MSLLGIDIGTTGCKVIAFNKSAEILSYEYFGYPLIHPNEGWMELDAEYIWIKIKESISKINYKIKKDNIKAFSVSCQGEAIIPVDRFGNSLYNAIVTFDSRTYDQYKFWLKNLGKKEIFKITGMPLHPMYSINKIMWIKKNYKDIFKKTYKFLCFEDYIYMKFGLKNNVMGVTGGHDQACGAFGSGIVEEGTAMHAAGTSDVITAIFNQANLNEEMLKNNY